ncbi:transcriptional regulator [Lactobacillus xylocopicola]|uniref:Transcriptional regulator n=2 Tax=Lactobacillus xylocopicola TaxID=2976676 RepID=A0ABM8BFD6_9LACO|nr:transcriptional regulator [Lactobacillus xylocopicola]
MVKATFTNLPATKKALVQSALLREFSNYPLQKAQVARIVKDAGIARGAFYKYFDDLPDSYQYLYQCALKEIHAHLKIGPIFDPKLFYQSVVQFIEHTQSSKFAELIKMHVLSNESVVAKPFSNDASIELSPQNWSAMVLSHATIHMVLENPRQKKAVLSRFKAGLELLEKGAN